MTVARRRVLVADNSLDIAKVLGEVLSLEPDIEAIGYVLTGAEALARGRRGDADVIVLDLGLPDCSGFTVLETLRAEGLTTKVVIYTGHSSAAVIDRARRLGASCVIKGGDFDDLVAAIRAA
jgi:DNA-binding NarL/FixJ family response regulator